VRFGSARLLDRDVNRADVERGHARLVGEVEQRLARGWNGEPS
jgi:hypothetical protein